MAESGFGEDPGARFGYSKKLEPKVVPPQTTNIAGKICEIQGVFRDYADDNYCKIEFHGKQPQDLQSDDHEKIEFLGAIESHDYDKVVQEKWIEQQGKEVMTEQ